MVALTPFTDEQARLLVNLRQRYEVWIGAEQQRASLPYDLRRKTVAGHDLPPASGPYGLLVDYARRRHIRAEV